jgi:hypothetical protein
VIRENALDCSAKVSFDAGIAESILKKDRYQFVGNKVTHKGFPQQVLPDTASQEVIPPWAKTIDVG